MKSLTINQKIGVVISAIAFTVIATFVFNYHVQIAKALGFRYTVDATIATTTPYQTFMLAGGAVATTYINSDGAEQVSLFTMLGSSTTPPTIAWRVQYSPYSGVDCIATPTGCDWYDQDALLGTNSTSTAHVRDGAVDTWAYASTTANQTVVGGANSVKFITKRIDILNINSTYTRVVWSVTGANALLNVRPSLKNTIIQPK